VVGEIPEFAIATGIPAKVMRDRRGPADGNRQTADGNEPADDAPADGSREPADRLPT